jgi:outer membrane protein assembly factor BamD (BamD/ComL family)
LFIAPLSTFHYQQTIANQVASNLPELQIIFMKKVFLIFSLFVCFFAFSANSFAQKPIEQQTQLDPILETDAKHNLEVAQNYFRLKKAYRAVLMRFEETFAAYPDFSKMDEFLYIAGMSSFYLSNNKGKQKLNEKATEDEKQKYDPVKLRDDARTYLKMLIEKYPNSSYKSDAEKTLKELDTKK